jgi:predicted TIM-barrel fold metal-dependent hydrolase
MLKTGLLWVKVSAAYRLSDLPTWDDMAPLVKSMAQVAPDRLVWASDWPHTGGLVVAEGSGKIQEYRKVDIGMFIKKCKEWFDNDEELLAKLFYKNAEHLWFDI